MAGDPLEDAFRAELADILAAASIPWPLKDTENTGVQPKASDSWVDLEFHAPVEKQAYWGSPGANLWRETGQVEIGIFASRNTGHDLIGAYARAIRDAFRDRIFTHTSAGRQIRCTEVTPLQQGHLDAWWMRSLLITYRVFNIA